MPHTISYYCTRRTKKPDNHKWVFCRGAGVFIRHALLSYPIISLPLQQENENRRHENEENDETSVSCNDTLRKPSCNGGTGIPPQLHHGNPVRLPGQVQLAQPSAHGLLHADNQEREFQRLHPQHLPNQRQPYNARHADLLEHRG